MATRAVVLCAQAPFFENRTMPIGSTLINFVILVLAAVTAIGAFQLAVQMWIDRRPSEARAGLARLDLHHPQNLIDRVAAAWRRRGHQVESNPGADATVTLRLRREGERWLVHCQSDPNQAVELALAKDLLRRVAAESASGAIIVTRGAIADDVRRSARGQPLRLIDATGLWQLLADSLEGADQRRALRRIGALHSVRVALPALIGLGLAVYSVLGLVHFFGGDAAEPMAPETSAATAAAAGPPSASMAPPPVSTPPTAGASTPDGSASAMSAAAAARAGKSDEALRDRRDALTAELGGIDQVTAVQWIAQDQIVLTAAGALNPNLADDACAALARYPEYADARLRLSTAGANQGFETLPPAMVCR